MVNMQMQAVFPSINNEQYKFEKNLNYWLYNNIKTIKYFYATAMKYVQNFYMENCKRLKKKSKI